MTGRQKDTSILLKGAGSAYIIKILGIGLLYIYHLALARFLGSEDYGLYVYVFTITGLLAVISELGLNRAAIKFFASFLDSRNYTKFKGVLIRSHQILIVSGLLMVLGTLCVIFIFQNRFDRDLSVAFLIMVWRIPIQSLIQIRQQVARACKNIFRAFFPEQILLPLLALAIFVGLYLTQTINYKTALLGYLSASVVTFLVGWKMVVTILPAGIRTVQSEYNTKELLTVSLPMLFATIMHIVLHRTDIVMLGAMASVKDVGIYNAAFRIATLNTFPLVAVNTITTPMIASIFYQNDMKRLQEFVLRATKWIVLFSLPTVVVIVGLRAELLGLFGNDFVVGQFALILMAVGSFVNAASGSVGALLTMTGNQNLHATIQFGAAVTNVALNIILIPAYGLNGAAAATCITTILLNVSMVIASYRRLGVRAFFMPSSGSGLILLISIIAYFLLAKVLNIFLLTALFLILIFFVSFQHMLNENERRELVSLVFKHRKAEA